MESQEKYFTIQIKNLSKDPIFKFLKKNDQDHFKKLSVVVDLDK